MPGEAQQCRQTTWIFGRTTGTGQCQLYVRVRFADGGVAQRAGDGRSQVRTSIAEDSEQVHGQHPDDRIRTAQT
jgi:hypothetical protein